DERKTRKVFLSFILHPSSFILSEDGEVGQVAILVVVVQPVTDDKGIGDVEAKVVRLQGDGLPTELAEQHHDADGQRAEVAQVADKMGKRVARIEDVVQQQDVTAANVGNEVGADAQLVGRGDGTAITRRLKEADAQRQVEAANKVGEENQAAGQHADDGERLAVVVLGNLPGQFADPR